MKVEELLGTAKDAITVKRVYAEPFEKDGLTIVAAAAVSGGAGGGTGHDKDGQEGEGGGFGMRGHPVGAYVIKNGQVTWRPAVDANRAVLMVGLVALTYLLTRRRPPRAWRRSKRS